MMRHRTVSFESRAVKRICPCHSLDLHLASDSRRGVVRTNNVRTLWAHRGRDPLIRASISERNVLSLPIIAGEQFGGYHHRRRPTSAPAPGEGHWVHGLVVRSLPFRRPPFSYSRLSSPPGLFLSVLPVIGWAQVPFPPMRPATSTNSWSCSW